MLDVCFAVPGDWETPTGGYAYDRRVAALLGGHAIAVHRLSLPGAYPEPDEAALAAAGRLLADTPDDATLLVDGLAYATFPGALIASLKRRIVALVHHPLGLETGLADDRRRALIASERQALAHAARVIVTSAATARTLVGDFGVAAERVVVAEPGTDPAPRASGGGNPPRILAVGAIVPRKGHDVLVEALASIAMHPWQACFAGSTDRAAATVAALRARIARANLGGRIVLAGALGGAALEEAYAAADIFVLASHHEGYGMVVAEAMARGLAIVTTTGGAAADTVPDGAAIKVPPGDAPALARAIAGFLTDQADRRRHADAAWTAGQRLPRWADTAARIAGTIATVASRRTAP